MGTFTRNSNRSITTRTSDTAQPGYISEATQPGGRGWTSETDSDGVPREGRPQLDNPFRIIQVGLRPVRRAEKLCHRKRLGKWILTRSDFTFADAQVELYR